MKHLLKGLAFFVGFNAIITLGICWYNFLLGNGFNPIGIDSLSVSGLVSMGIFFGLMGWIVVYFVSLEND